MGFFSNIANRIRQAWTKDKEQVAVQLAKGATAAGYPGSGYDILQAYGYEVLADYLRLEQDLLSRYADYEEMDDYPELSAAIDVFADDSTQPDTQLNRTVWVTSSNQNIANMLNDLLNKQLRLDEEIWEIARTLIKYGNDFEELLVTADGVVGFNYLPPPTVRRIEGPRGELYGFIQDFKGRFGYCLAHGSRVWTDRGLTEIQAFERGSVLGCSDGKPALLPVKQLHVNGTKKVYKVRTRHREVFLTEDHPVLAQRLDGSREWVRVKDLRIVRYRGKKRNIDYSRTSKIVVSTRMPAGEIPEWSSLWAESPFEVPWGDQGTPRQLQLPERPSAGFCRLLGFLLGDGWRSKSEAEGRVAYARGEYPEQNELYDNLLAALGLDPRVKQVRSDGAVVGEETVVCSVQLWRLLPALGWIDGFDKKRVPAWVYTLPEDHREAFLRGFLDADGWVNKQPRRKLRHFFEIANYDLARDLKNLIDGLGYVCGNISSRTREPGTVVKGKVIQTQQPCYTVSFTDERFAEPLVAETVLEVSYHGDEEVFDLEVEDDAHNFVADGVVVHNSPEDFRQILATRTALIAQEYSKQHQMDGGNQDEQLAALEDWEVVHFRLRGKHRRSVYGSCLTGESRVWTTRGLVEIRDVVPGDRVFSRHAGMLRTTKVLDHVCNGSKPVYRLSTKHRSLRLTANHPVLVEGARKGNQNAWLPVSEVKPGDRLVAAARQPYLSGAQPLGILLSEDTETCRVTLTPRGAAALRSFVRRSAYGPRDEGLRAKASSVGVSRGTLEDLLEGRSSVPKSLLRDLFSSLGLPLFDGSYTVRSYDGAHKIPRLSDFVDASFCRLFGFMLGDGWVRDNEVGFALGEHDAINARYERMFDEMGLGSSRSGGSCTVHSRVLAEVFQRFGWVGGAHHKRVPSWVFVLPEELRAEFVRGFVDADGWETHQGPEPYFHIELCNEALLRDLKNLVDGLGWTSGNIRSRKREERPVIGGREINTGPSYQLYFREAPLAAGDFASEEVVSIEPDGEELVYDIEVADREHNFVADGLVVHNSVLEAARWIWKRLMLLEDSALLYRLTRAPERFAFYVDVGNLPPAEALAYVNRVRQQYKKRRFVNPTTGKLDFSFDALSQDEDFFLPTRQGQEGTRIDVLSGPQWQHMDDIEYFQGKMFSAIKIPKAYLQQDDNTARAVLSSEDVRFARTVLRIQRELRNGLGKVCRVHMAALGMDPQAYDYEVHMTVPSSIYELAQLEVRNAQADLASRMREFVSLEWIYKEVFDLSDDAIKLIYQQRESDVRDETVWSAKADAAAAALEAPMEGADQPALKAPSNGNGKHRRAGRSLHSSRTPSLEQQLLAGGGRAAERRAGDKLDRLLQGDEVLRRSLKQLRGLVQELTRSSQG